MEHGWNKESKLLCSSRQVLEAQAEMVSRDEFSTSRSCPAESTMESPRCLSPSCRPCPQWNDTSGLLQCRTTAGDRRGPQGWEPDAHRLLLPSQLPAGFRLSRSMRSALPGCALHGPCRRPAFGSEGLRSTGWPSGLARRAAGRGSDWRGQRSSPALGILC